VQEGAPPPLQSVTPPPTPLSEESRVVRICSNGRGEGPLYAPLFPIYLLFYYKSTNSDAETGDPRRHAPLKQLLTAFVYVEEELVEAGHWMRVEEEGEEAITEEERVGGGSRSGGGGGLGYVQGMGSIAAVLLLHMRARYSVYICVLILLYMCSHAAPALCVLYRCRAPAAYAR
jgi:hypothetical protein